MFVFKNFQTDFKKIIHQTKHKGANGTIVNYLVAKQSQQIQFFTLNFISLKSSFKVFV